MGFGDLQRGNSVFFLFLFSAYGITCTLYCTQYIHIYIYVYIYIYIYIQMYTYTYMCTYTYMHHIASHREICTAIKPLGHVRTSVSERSNLPSARSPVQASGYRLANFYLKTSIPNVTHHYCMVQICVCKFPCYTMVSGVFNIGGTGLILVILLTYCIPCTLHPHFTWLRHDPARPLKLPPWRPGT